MKKSIIAMVMVAMMGAAHADNSVQVECEPVAQLAESVMRAR